MRVMTWADPRENLERLIKERREDYAGLSRLIGRNATYIQQYVKRGVPRRLAEKDRRTLAAYFGVPESMFGAPGAHDVQDDQDLVGIVRLDVRASAGAGALGEGAPSVSKIPFDRAWLRQLCGARLEDLSLIRVEGDSMFPTLADGDEIMVDGGDDSTRLRDGIYVLSRDGELVVKRLAVNPVTRLITLKSDNPNYPDWPGCRPEDVRIAGRVVWSGRRIR